MNLDKQSKSALAEHMSSSIEYNVTITINAAINSSSSEKMSVVSQSRQIIRPAQRISELSLSQLTEHKKKRADYLMRKKKLNEINVEMRIVLNAIKSSARQYILSIMIKSISKKIIISLATKFQRSYEKIVKQLQKKVQSLKISSIKNKIEQWISEWKDVRSLIQELKTEDVFESESLFVNEFLKADEIWASLFCQTWIQQFQTFDQSVDFYKTTAHYRLTIENDLKFKLVVAQANQASLQDYQSDFQRQQQKFQQNQQNQRFQKTKNPKSDKSTRKCLCKKKHYFSTCLYIVKSARSKE